jgi:hypothetical protein
VQRQRSTRVAKRVEGGYPHASRELYSWEEYQLNQRQLTDNAAMKGKRSADLREMVERF